MENLISRKEDVETPTILKTYPSFDIISALWTSQPFEDISSEYVNFIQANPALELILNLGPCVTWIIDLRSLNFTFISSNVKSLIGYDEDYLKKKGIQNFYELIHPENLPKTHNLLNSIWENIFLLPRYQRAKIKYNLDYRLKKKNGEYIRILEQCTVLQTDYKGNITHIMGVGSDISNWKEKEKITATVISVGDEKTITIDTDHPELKPQNYLSKREKEILKLIADGYNSKCIADKLSISFHTVNTHRQNLIHKTNAKNTSCLIQYAINQGII
ncbi:hypothetical protein BH23BAC1_BH23BAC1_08930 [soil metagenome]